MTRDPAPRLTDDRDWAAVFACELERTFPGHPLIARFDAWRAEQREQRRRPSDSTSRRPMPWEKVA